MRTSVSARLRCSECGSDNLHVVDSRGVINRVNLIRRRRECLSCGNRMTFMEVPVENYKAYMDFMDSLDNNIELLTGVVDSLRSVVRE